MNESAHLIYVSPQGNDEAEGTKAQPFTTLKRAQIEARNARSQGELIRVLVEEGTYYLEETLQFKPEDSGTTDAPIRYEALGDNVVISGGARLQLEWSTYKGEILQASTPEGLKLDQLFINGQQIHMARYPSFSQETRIMNGYAADCISEDRVKRWNNPEGGFVHAMHSHLWGGYHYLITGKDESNQLLLEGGWQNNRQMGMHNEYRYVENIFEELDAPGEWFHDEKTGILYVYPYPNTNLQDAVIEGVRLAHLVELIGTEEEPVRNIHFKGFTFTRTSRTFMLNKEPLLRSDWTTYRGGAMLLRGSDNCVVEDCHFDQLGGNAVFVDGYNRDFTIRGCHISNVGANGISFVGNPSSVRSPLFEYQERQNLSNIDLTPGPATNDYPSNGLVEDCLIYRVGRVEKQSAPVQISMSLDITVRHCSIYETPRAGINISEGTFGGHMIENCDVFDTVLETGDHGSFNSWGRDRFWLLEDVDMDKLNSEDETDGTERNNLPTLDMVRPNIIRNNRMRCDYGWDIDLDDGSSWYHIYNNLSLAGGIKLREGFYRVCENNIMVNNSLHPHVWFKGSRDVVRNNIVFTEYAPIQLPEKWGQECDWNLLHEQDAKEVNAASQLQQLSGADVHSITADALFVDPSSGNYQVHENSPALGLGFKNFPMDEFGVRKAELKKIARTPKLPQVGYVASMSGRLPQKSQWDGCKVKNVVGMGEVSAAGLPSEIGVVIETIPWGSWQMDKGFQVGDVILGMSGEKVDTVDDLFRIYSNHASENTLQVIVFRGQRETELLCKFN